LQDSDAAGGTTQRAAREDVSIMCGSFSGIELHDVAGVEMPAATAYSEGAAPDQRDGSFLAMISASRH